MLSQTISLFGSVDSMIATLVIILITAISSWLQKRSQAQESSKPDGHGMPRRPGHPEKTSAQDQPAPGPDHEVDWQKELRRLWEGDHPPDPVPPVVIQEARIPTAPPQVSASKAIVLMPAARSSKSKEGTEGNRMTEAVAAYRKAQHLPEDASSHLHRIVEPTRQHDAKETRARQSAASREIVSAITLVRSRDAVRQAFVASVVLGPPKALEN